MNYTNLWRFSNVLCRCVAAVYLFICMQHQPISCEIDNEHTKANLRNIYRAKWPGHVNLNTNRMAQEVQHKMLSYHM